MKAAGVPIALLLLAGSLPAQQVRWNFDKLAARASDSTDVSLDGAVLQLAGKFLSDDDKGELGLGRDGIDDAGSIDCDRFRLRCGIRACGYERSDRNGQSEDADALDRVHALPTPPHAAFVTRAS